MRVPETLSACALYFGVMRKLKGCAAAGIMQMIGKSQHREKTTERVAVKDMQLVYRACSSSFAQALGYDSPDLVIGRTDFDLLPRDLATRQLMIDKRVTENAVPDINALALEDAMGQVILRSPILSEQGKVNGLDIRLLDGPVSSLPQAQDYQSLVNLGLQGTVVLRGESPLFLNQSARTIFELDSSRFGSDLDGLKRQFAQEDWNRLCRRVAADTLEKPNNLPARLVLNICVSGINKVLLADIDKISWQGEPAAVLSVVDVTAQKLVTRSAAPAVVNTPVNLPAAQPGVASQKLNQAQQLERDRYRHYAKASADFFWETDENLHFSRISPEIETALGVEVGSLIGRTHEDLLSRAGDANDSASWDQHLQTLADHKPFRDFEFKWIAAGETKVVRYSGIPVYNSDSVFMGYRGAGRDVTASTKQAESVAYHANHDALTGLVNRRHFEALVKTAIENVRVDRKPHALFFMDLDNFKIVNDTCGHLAGDELLRQLSSLFTRLVRKSDVLARLGGDEFGVFLYNCNIAQALKLANQLRSEVENFQFLWEENRFMVGVSIGLVVADDRWPNLEALFSAADSACYIAKNEGRNQVVVHREADGKSSNRKIETHWVEEINAALDESRIVIAQQKILPLQGLDCSTIDESIASKLKSDDGAHFEVLMRLVAPNGELVNPKAFLPSAERYGLSARLDATVIDVTLEWLKRNPGYLQRVRHCSINLASGSFAKEGFADALIEHIKDSGIPPTKLCFEMTETATIANLSAATDFMNRLAELGCRFVLDDFGAGLSSFAYLKNLPIDFLKIDGRLVRNIRDDQIDFTMVKAINQVGQSLGKRTIAEFVETPQLFETVCDIGVDYAQGFEISKPSVVKL